MSIETSFARWRHLHRSRAEIAATFEQVQALAAAGELERALAIAAELVEHAPSDPALLLWLVRTCAARGDTDRHARYLGEAFYAGVTDARAAAADPTLRGDLSAAKFVAKFGAPRAYSGNDRSRDFWLTEVEPRRDNFCTTLRWKPEHRAAVQRELRAFCEDCARVERIVFPRQRAWISDWWERAGAGTQLDLEGEGLPSAFCHLGRLAAMVVDLAPYLEDVRALFFDQSSPLYEIWVVAGEGYLRRHDIHADREGWEYLDDLAQREGIRDRALEELLLERYGNKLEGWLEGASAEALRARIVRLGADTSHVDAKRRLLCGDDDDAIEILEAQVPRDADPALRAQLLGLYLQRDLFADALRLLGPEDTRLRALVYEGLGRHADARALHERHIRDQISSSGVLLREADELFARGWFESAQLYYARLADTTELGVPIRAELGVARCAEQLGRADDARHHYARVLARAPAQRRAYATSWSIVAAIEHCEHAAIRWLRIHQPA